ncbi:MAG TPA: hypothetical protein VEK34_02245 [Methylocella sp.]|nr:hypothetical protein [Methylocella sp.]
MVNDTLYIITCISNPLQWTSRITLARDVILDWAKEPNVSVVMVECVHGARSPSLMDLTAIIDASKLTYKMVHATTAAWSKENLMNIGVSSLPDTARYLAFFDADIRFRLPGWASGIMDALQLYPVIQPWQTCYDLGPNDEHLEAHSSFASLYYKRGQSFKSKGLYGKQAFPHPGYAWAWTRVALDAVGGLFELGGMGSGDHHMALGLIGRAKESLPCSADNAYANAVMVWQRRATALKNKLGFAPYTIEHKWHGDKNFRGYTSRWRMFINHQFDPNEDLKRNSYGVVEFAGNKPELEREFDNYLRSRMEDANMVMRD